MVTPEQVQIALEVLKYLRDDEHQDLIKQAKEVVMNHLMPLPAPELLLK